MTEQLQYYAQRGHQIVFDEHGIRAWYRYSAPSEKVYEGCSTDELFNSMNAHWPTTLIGGGKDA